MTKRLVELRKLNFYPRSPCGERLLGSAVVGLRMSFLSTLSLRRATWLDAGCLPRDEISIHALLAESDFYYADKDADWVRISIHALLAESDRVKMELNRAASNFYPRSPCGERQQLVHKRYELDRFLSTLSLRRATAKVHKTVGHFCTYETNFMGIASSY